MKRLEGKIALVTGGSRGIGAAIAEAFAREGSRVVIASRKQEGLDETAGEINARYPDSVLAKTCHVGDPDQVDELVAWAEAEAGLPTVLVNNAATNPYFGPLLGVEERAWDKTFEVNLKGYFYMARAVAKKLMAEKSKGAIVNVTSVVGMRAAPAQGVYAMTKAGVISMTQTLAVELGPAGIRVNAIAPGLVETRFARLLVNNPNLRRMFTDRSPLDRHAQPEEIAGLAVYLASDESSYLTGQTIPVDGGYTIT
jgi:NAD(P)-dependent dehydrogenase (short-subunit alcohol dehydrogenase family)